LSNQISQTMTDQTGFWWSVGRAFYKYFHGLEWVYDQITPNIVCIVLGFVCFAWWMKLQMAYNKKALKEGTYK
jgi:hypothetical protein